MGRTSSSSSTIPPSPVATTTTIPPAAPTGVVTVAEGGVRRSSDAAPARRICKYFASGHCRRGDSCSYSHHPTTSSSSSSSPAPSSSSSSHLHRKRYRGEGTSATVHLPWEADNTYEAPHSPGTRYSHWNLLVEQLEEFSVSNTTDLEELLVELLPPVGARVHPQTGRPLSKKDVFLVDATQLRRVLEEDAYMSDAQRRYFLTSVVPFMKAMVRLGPTLFPDGLPLLTQGHEGVVRLTEAQVFCLLCCAFFNLFPARHFGSETQLSLLISKDEPGSAAHWKDYNRKTGYFSFSPLFGFDQSQARSKIRCFLQYFMTQRQRSDGDTTRITRSTLIVEYIRVSGRKKSITDGESSGEGRWTVPNFQACAAALTDVTMHLDGVIEDGVGELQVDFANQVLGGGVLRRGCVQEEIRFAVCPELLVSRLIAETLLPEEAFFMNGARTFSIHDGYASTFQFQKAVVLPPLPPAVPPHLDGVGAAPPVSLANVALVALDAVNYCNSPSLQYLANWIQRDTIKAYVGFRGTDLATLRSCSEGPIATGNWGCGAFAGDAEMKLLQQWVAASAAGRALEYYAFGRAELVEGFRELQKGVLAAEWTVRDLYGVLLQYNDHRYEEGEGALLARRGTSVRAGVDPISDALKAADDDIGAPEESGTLTRTHSRRQVSLFAYLKRQLEE